MTAAHRLDLRMGLTRVVAPQYASEPGFVSQVNKQMRALRDDLEYIFSQFEDVTPEITVDAIQPTFDKSQTYVPVLTGDLKASGYLEIVERGQNSRVEMGYARGGEPRYAVYVHEMVEVPHAPPTRSKFLEAAITEDYGQIIDKLSDGYKKFMGV